VVCVTDALDFGFAFARHLVQRLDKRLNLSLCLGILEQRNKLIEVVRV
jgi:hypothetical protein